MAAVLPPLIAAGGFGLYFLTSFRLARYRRVPWEFLAVVAAGAALGVYRLVAAPGAGTAIGAALALGILAFACWFSSPSRCTARPRTGRASASASPTSRCRPPTARPSASPPLAAAACSSSATEGTGDRSA